MKNIIFIAPPAAGKGTYSNYLKENYNYEHLSTGDMLREEISLGTDLGLKVKNIIDNGGLVDDDTITELLKNKLNKILGKPFVLDGFPRTLNQADTLDNIFKEFSIDYIAIYLTINEEDALKRTLGRLTCKCGRSYNINNPEFTPKVEGICDSCGEKLIKRNDDNETSFKVRFNTYLDNTKHIIDHYEKLNKLVQIDAMSGSDNIIDELKKAIND